jgi:hypothetical protein
MQRVLSFEQTPPLSVPLRFFLSAPLFSLAAALVLLWHGDAGLSSRWNPATLALTHLLTLGFLGLCMIGATLQILPVIAGVEVPRPRPTANCVHLLLSIGAAMLAAGFVMMERWLFLGALMLLGSAFLVFLGACWLGLRGVESENATLDAVRLALLSLAGTLVLGMTLGSAFIWPVALPIQKLTDLHASWGLAGWVGLLVVAVAYQVVPMFQATEIYPRILTRWLARSVFAVLGLASLSTLLLPPEALMHRAASVAAALLYIAFGLVTWHRIRHRKRPKPEPTSFFWYAGLASLIAANLLFGLAQFLPMIKAHAAYPLCLGVLFIVGFAYSVVNGMLYKIVPFLIWYHLQDKLINTGRKAPNVRQVIPETAARGQFIAHAAALLLLLAAALWPAQLARAAALGFMASSFWLWLNLLRAARFYRTSLADSNSGEETIPA